MRWTDKAEARDAVRVIVRDEVYKLPVTSYPDEVLGGCITEIFEYFYTRDLAA